MTRLRVLGALVTTLLLTGCLHAGPPGSEAANPAPEAANPAEAAAGCVQAVSADAPIERLAGGDRYATAACVSATVYAAGADHVLVARGDAEGGLADALAGAVLANAVGGPILLTAPDRLPDATRVELERLAPEQVTILGGANAVSPGVEQALGAIVPAVERIPGTTRYDTAAAISERAATSDVAFVVNGFRPADSLVAAAPAARRGGSLLLVSGRSVPPVTEAALAGASEVVIVGGHGVVSEAVEAELRRIAGAGAVRRVSGGTRAETAASVARAFPEEGVRYLSGQQDANLVDAATAGWAAALPGGGPVLYVERDRPGQGADRYLRLGGLRHGPDVVGVRLVGGRAVLSDALVTALETRYAEALAGGPPAELRGMWVHLFDATLKTRTGIHRMLDAAARANLNTVIVQVARRQDAYYDSSRLPRTVDPEMAPDLDLLAELVPAAHARGLAVHAWVSVMPAYHSEYDGLDLGEDHVWTRHGPASADHWVTQHFDGRWGSYLDPGVAAVQNHVAAVLRELATGTGVDAVHVDYLRYESGAWGYHPSSVARFRAQEGGSGRPAPGDPAWQAWRRRQTGDLARRIMLEVADADRGVAVTLAASTMGAGPASSGGFQGTRTYRDVFQDWPAWLADGRIDAAFPMNYFREAVPEHRAWYDDWVRFEGALPRGNRLVAVGGGSYLNRPEQSLAQITRARAATDGYIVYSYQQNTSTADAHGLVNRLPSTVNVDPAPAPAIVRRSASAGHLAVRVVDGVDVTLEPVGGGPAVTPVRADATGRANFLSVPAGEWVVKASGYQQATVQIAGREVTRVTLTAL
jgi:uncharacterized lipoprotein YddW (UPF0748 family)/putative cell wall-binding protein